MDDKESKIAPLLSHPNPSDNNKCPGEKGMYMDWLGRPADDRDDLGGWNRALWNAGKRKKLHESPIGCGRVEWVVLYTRPIHWSIFDRFVGFNTPMVWVGLVRYAIGRYSIDLLGSIDREVR